MAKDKDYQHLIHTDMWLRLRRQALTEHPLCVLCEKDGYVTAATEVHHREPVERAESKQEMRTLMYDYNNLMPLCHDCHVKIHVQLGRRDKEARKMINEARLERFKKKFICD